MLKPLLKLRLAAAAAWFSGAGRKKDKPRKSPVARIILMTLLLALGINERLQGGNFVCGEGIAARECGDKCRQRAGKRITHDFLGLTGGKFLFGDDDFHRAAVVDEQSAVAQLFEDGVGCRFFPLQMLLAQRNEFSRGQRRMLPDKVGKARFDDTERCFFHGKSPLKQKWSIHNRLYLRIVYHI